MQYYLMIVPFLRENMIGIVIRIILSLFVMWVLPALINAKLKKHWHKFIKWTCYIIGTLILIYAVIDLIQSVI